MVEFALVLPLLIAMVFGIVEFGTVFLKAQAVEAAAREGGRLASLSTTTAADVTARVNASLAGVVPGATSTVSASCVGRQGQTVTVTVRGQDEITIPLVVTRTINLTGTAVFRCEA